MKPKILQVCNYQINQFANEQISKAVNKAIDETGYNYTDYVTFKHGQNEQIIAIETNAKQITHINNTINDKINEAISKFDLQQINIHLGSLTGINFFSGRGFKIPIKIVSKGIANSEIISKLEDAGINQTLHRIRIKVQVNIAGFFAGFTTNVTTQSDCLLAESIIVGQIPSSYTKFHLI